MVFDDSHHAHPSPHPPPTSLNARMALLYAGLLLPSSSHTTSVVRRRVMTTTNEGSTIAVHKSSSGES
jgi:hypothetical protein